MSSLIKRQKLITISTIILFLTSLTAASFTINILEEPYNSEKYSANTDTVKVVELLDTDGEPVDQQTLEDNSNLRFEYEYDNQEGNMSNLQSGYYYAHFTTVEDDKNITITLTDTAPTSGGQTEERTLVNIGDVGIEIETEIPDQLQPGEEIQLSAEVNDQANYYEVQGTGDENVYVLDTGGSGTYSAEPDEVIAGSAPENGVELTSNNPWSGETHKVAFTDESESNTWEPSQETIILDMFGGGTISTQTDTVLNTGDSPFVSTSSGRSLNSVNDIRNEVMFVSEDNHFSNGDITVLDRDESGIYTDQPDTIIAGNEPSPGTEITYANNINPDTKVSSYTTEQALNEEMPFNTDRDILAVDYDQSGQYTVQADEVLAGSTPSEGDELIQNEVGNWRQNVDPGEAEEGDVVYYQDESGTGFDENNDAIWMEAGQSSCYDESEDTLLVGSAETGLCATGSGGISSDWENISGYVHDGDTMGYDADNDAIIMDYYGGGTFATRSDALLAGSITEGFNAGTDYTVQNGFVEHWNLSSIIQIEGAEWESTRDTILLDHYNTGKYSATEDEIINAGDSSAEPGTELQQLNDASNENLMWSDNDLTGEYTDGDEIIIDHDEDFQYTSVADQHLAGVNPETMGETTSLIYDNPWSDSSTPIMFYQHSENTEFDPEEDAIIRDLDNDGYYTAEQDVVVNDVDDMSIAEPGSSLSSIDGSELSSLNVEARFKNISEILPSTQLGKQPDGLYTNNIEIPDNPGSKYLLNIEADGEAHIQGAKTVPISIRERGLVFEVPSTFNLDIPHEDTYEEEIHIQNELNSDVDLYAEVTGEIENITSMPDTSWTMPSEGVNASVIFEIDRVEDYSGEITFYENDSDNQLTTEINLNMPHCQTREERLCSDQEQTLNYTSFSRESIEDTVELKYLGPSNNSVEINTSISSEISPYVSVQNPDFTMSESSFKTITVNPRHRGNFSGTVQFSGEENTLTHDLNLEANVEQLERDLTVFPQEWDIGGIPEGDQTAESFELENTGNLEITNLTISSDDTEFESDLETETLNSEDTAEFDITVPEVDFEEARISVRGDTTEGGVSSTIEITASPVTQFEAMDQSLRDEIRNLRGQAETMEQDSDLTDVEANIATIESEWNAGNYEQAYEEYQSQQSQLSSIESDIQASQQQPQNGGQDQTGQDPQTGGDDSGGLPILLILIVLLIILIGGGIVFVLSYVPEEGDPLYEQFQQIDEIMDEYLGDKE